MGNSGSSWSFDVSALMVLIGETEEFKYRLMQRSLLECLSPCPVVGLQSYVHSYSWLLDPSDLVSYSPYGCREAPLWNMRLAKMISIEKLLDDTALNVYKIPTPSSKHYWAKSDILLGLWWAMSWMTYIGLVVLLFEGPGMTWIGQSTCIGLPLWSIILRVCEFSCLFPRPNNKHVSRPTDLDAIYILGRRDSAFILEGSRQHIKDWTESGLQFRGATRQSDAIHKWLSSLLQHILRLGSLLVLIFVFTTLPNGNTIDQIAFVLLNLLGQANVLVGQKLNAKRLLAQLDPPETHEVTTRTAIYAFLIRRFRGATPKWFEKAGLLPETVAWRRWGDQVALRLDADPKDLYDEIDKEIIAERPPVRLSRVPTVRVDKPEYSPNAHRRPSKSQESLEMEDNGQA